MKLQLWQEHSISTSESFGEPRWLLIFDFFVMTLFVGALGVGAFLIIFNIGGN